MPVFSNASKAQLATVHPRLREVCEEAIKIYDFTVLEGHRGKAAQDKAYRDGFSKVKWPNGNHNSYPSKAVDLAPYPVSWAESSANMERFGVLAGVMLACAFKLGVKIRWGGDWNRNQDTRDEKFRDRPHFELDE